VSKCPYCDFNSHVRADVDDARWRDALLADMAHEAVLTASRPLSSIFFGGGTPSLMAPATVAALIAAAERHWGFAPDVEITLEANPTSVEATRFRGYRAAGVNRVSMGIQALNDYDLRRLGRLHRVAEALKAVAVAARNFQRFSFDPPIVTRCALESCLSLNPNVGATTYDFKAFSRADNTDNTEAFREPAKATSFLTGRCQIDQFDSKVPERVNDPVTLKAFVTTCR
jgi:hypothetical protein